ncbi:MULTISPECIES: 16S rRNA (uracil(1498)-N(3))-methyltransferase [Tissierellales]|uniref:Ribosomal RNA small subunit methyltransferase E n=1 Tax=Acidilutibacter cellobiosedens TaxID=2507161 RepID=A0A410QDT6_9FIRM|nr:MULTISPECIES: 16S rRNA (uracil(1498)-N(3))-methyltransferase [Tissierellales]QAT62157.1 16S rRNA (uracil(1498)-N(3))-methyltransferase [Acidilutibacter cellobiosedens]SCL84433.1 Ribosomal RNA small subunit methyltransferase E [Sporanaerobacter sp. PP17-6a]
MNRFFIKNEQVSKDILYIEGEDVKHIRDVLRLRTGDKIEAVCEGFIYIGKILRIEKNLVTVKIAEIFKGNGEPSFNIILYQGIPKGEKMDFIIQKCTELGVKEFFPLLTERTVVKVKDKNKEKSKITRWTKIAKEAAQQSKRDLFPKIDDIISFDDMIELIKGENIIVPYEEEKNNRIRDAIKSIKNGRVNLIIGPEGGFAQKEIETLRGIGANTVTLGPRILRTETAGIVAASILLYELGDI